MKRHILIGLMLLATGFGACKKIDCGGSNPGGPTNCAGVMCTAVYEEDHIIVRYSDGTPVQLDAFVVTDLNGSALPANNGNAVYGTPHSGNGGMYTVINDSWVAGHQNSSKNVRVKGYINFLQVFDVPATISADCCHVNMTTANGTITINRQ